MADVHELFRILKTMRKKFQFSIGFTLIEVLVVMGLIAILGSLMFGNFLKSQRRGFDAQRQADMKTIQNAFEQYYVANDGVYPVNDVEGGGEFPGGSMPLDPRNNGEFVYTVIYDPSGSGYCACALLEEIESNATDLPTTAQCEFGSTAPLPYVCVESLQ